MVSEILEYLMYKDLLIVSSHFGVNLIVTNGNINLDGYIDLFLSSMHCDQCSRMDLSISFLIPFALCSLLQQT